MDKQSLIAILLLSGVVTGVFIFMIWDLLVFIAVFTVKMIKKIFRRNND